jgi:hypothetical protein
MIAGVCFGYFVAVPAALHFLTTFAGSYVEANLTADSYLNFIMAYVAGLGLLFQLPLLLIFWNWISPLSGKKLLSTERFIILFAFIAAAMITPTPDPTNQAMVAVPIILIYQIGIIAVMIVNRRHKTISVSKAVPPAKKLLMPELPDIKRAAIPGVGLIPVLPDLEPVPVRETPPTIMPTVELDSIRKPAQQPLISRPVRRTIDGIQAQVVRPRSVRVQPPMQRAEARLITPRRPVAPRRQQAVSIDGVSRAYSA